MSRRHRPHYPHRLIMTATRTEVRRNNAASRSLEWIERAIARNDASTLQAWTAVFSVAADPNAVRSVVRGLATLMGELESVEKFAVVSNIPADQWRAQIDAAMSGIGVANLHANWAGNKQAMTTASVPLALRWLAQAMPDEGAVDVASDEVIALRADFGRGRNARRRQGRILVPVLAAHRDKATARCRIRRCPRRDSNPQEPKLGGF